MKKIVMFIGPCMLLFFSLGIVYGGSEGQPPDAMIKLENAKLPPVAFSHTSHVDKLKVQCAACHHQDPTEPKACTTCHKLETQGKTLSAKEAFHGNCVTCHKEHAQKVGKTGKAPTKCNECHKR